MVRHFVEQPLPSSFMLISIVGFLFSTFVVWAINNTWGFTLAVLFGIWFIAAVYNFTHAPGEDHLDVHHSNSKAKVK